MKTETQLAVNCVSLGEVPSCPGLQRLICQGGTEHLFSSAHSKEGSVQKREELERRDKVLTMTCSRPHELAGPRFAHLYSGHAGLNDLLKSSISACPHGMS